MGRWLTRDPLGYPDGPNQYAAFGGDPANSVDPMGTSAWTWFLGSAEGTANLASGSNLPLPVDPRPFEYRFNFTDPGQPWFQALLRNPLRT